MTTSSLLQTLAVLTTLQLSAAIYDTGTILFHGRGRNIYRARDIYNIVISPTARRGGATGRVLDSRSVGRGFKSYSKQRCVSWASCSHLCASVTKQYNLVPVKRRWCSAAGEVTAGLAESNGSLPPGGWLTVTCGLTACTPGSAPSPTLDIEYGKPFTFT